MKKKPNRKSWITSQLRRLSLRWPPRGKVLKASRRELPRKIKKDGTPFKKPNYEYQCNVCKEWFRSSDTQLDHIEPVVDPKAETTLSEEEFIGKFAVGLLCYEENFQVICHPCHDEKTKNEQKERFSVKKLDTSD
jgi:5-methylcytosine-specific restriction endonuclease McrA